MFGVDWQSVVLSLQLAFISTLLLLVVAAPLAWWLSGKNNWYHQVIMIIVAMPLVLPPTVLGFYLLLLFSPEAPVGQMLSVLGLGSLLFSFEGLVIASMVYSLPFVMQPLQNAFIMMGQAPLEKAYTMGISPCSAFFLIVLPLTRNSFVTAFALGFAHTLGEFGVVLMIGGSIPGETKVVSIALFEQVETLNYMQAHRLAFVLVVISFVLLLFAYQFNDKNYGRPR